MWPRRLAAVVASLSLVVLSSCGGGAGSGSGTFVDKEPLPADTMTTPMREVGHYGGRFTIGATSSPKTFNPIMANETSSNDIDNQMFVGLSDIDYHTLADIPVLARAWDFSDGGRTCTFHLRRGARFSDGHPITSADVLFSFDVVMSDSLHPSAQDGLIAKMDGQRVKYTYSAPDSFTFVVSAPRVDALLLAHVGSVRIVPKHVLESAFKAGTFAAAYGTDTPPEQVVTSGPFHVKAYVADQKVVLTRNPYWFGVDAQGHRLPYLDEIVFVVAKDQDVAALKFHAGEIDALDNVKPEDYKTFAAKEKAEDFTLYDVGPSYNTNFLWFNLNTLPEAKDGHPAGSPAIEPWKFALFSNPTFRRAVSYAIDREAIIRGPFFGFAEKNWAMMTSGNKRWYDSTVTAADYDVAKAKEALASLGLKDRNGDGILEDAKGNRLSFGMLTNGDNRLRVAIINLVKEDLAAVGIEIVPQPLDFNTLVQKTRTDFTYDSALLGLSSAVPADPGMGQNFYLSSGGTHYWHMRQKSPGTEAEKQLDALIQGNVSTLDPAERSRTYREMAQLLNDQAFVIWLPTQHMKLPVRARFGNIDPSPMPHRILWNSAVIFQKRPARGA